jgi:hypothetical protein
MTQFPPDDEKLIQFLKQYRPLPPAHGEHLEEQLIKLIEGQPKLSLGFSPRWWWMIPSILVATLLVAWGSSRQLSPSPQIAATSGELEDFLVDSWNGSMELHYLNSQTNTSNLDWLILADPESESEHLLQR